MTQYVLVASFEDEPPDVFGPFDDVASAQKAARRYREAWDIAGHENDDPTPEENEAWTAEGWWFGIVEFLDPATIGTVEIAP